MIKNLLYSFFLHFILIAAIYANFNLDIKEENPAEIVVTMELNQQQMANNSAINPQENQNKSEEDKEEKKEAEKIPEKKTEKKLEKKPTEKKTKVEKKSVKKPEIEKKKELAKIPEKEDKKEIVEKNPKEEKAEEKSKEDKEIKDEKEIAKEQANENKAQNNPNPTPDLTNSIENLNLSAREKLNIQTQLRRCYKRAIAETKLSSQAKIVITASISQDGYITSDIEAIKNSELYNDKSDNSYKIAVDNAARAIAICSPLRNLPSDKYQVWKEVTLQFDGNDAN